MIYYELLFLSFFLILIETPSLAFLFHLLQSFFVFFCLFFGVDDFFGLLLLVLLLLLQVDLHFILFFVDVPFETRQVFRGLFVTHDLDFARIPYAPDFLVVALRVSVNGIGTCPCSRS